MRPLIILSLGIIRVGNYNSGTLFEFAINIKILIANSENVPVFILLNLESVKAKVVVGKSYTFL